MFRKIRSNKPQIIKQEHGYGSAYAKNDTPAVKTTYQAGNEVVEVIAYEGDPQFVVIKRGEHISYPMTPEEAYIELNNIAKG